MLCGFGEGEGARRRGCSVESCLLLDGSRCRFGFWDLRGRIGEGLRLEL